jgi:hypothetical protein
MSIMGKHFTVNNIEECLRILEKPNILIELMCHPSYSFIGDYKNQTN